MSEPVQVWFDSSGTRCSGRFFPVDGDTAEPVIVMAHGLGGTVDSGLEPFATRFAENGYPVFAFDYRGFGESEGRPRQKVSLTGQVDDYRAACRAVAELPGVDASRIVLWGVSLAGGHVLQAAVGRDDIAAVVSLVPMVSGMAAARHALPAHSASTLARSTATGVVSSVRQRFGGRPATIPLVGPPGSLATLTVDGYQGAYEQIAGPSWRNEVDASIGSELGRYRAHKAAREVTAPLLVQIADFDQAAPPHAAAKAAFAGRAQVRHYPCDHFDVFAGRDWFEPAVTHQLDFLAATLH
ncbi:putative hydrolase, alpha/beta fold protein [Gordonia spumicola]|uniref:Putative hydrolase, alpha/beta fold protein n=1 Tax=Gordonia spumicola TaxID=589161 RepID=A0A7I9VCH4_9ACTN|nr:alpha/beta hydrolase [Gordonia spumicola]GEE02783.1 putative hydrolase, alpha/beta fold protein [Gordonia spumicola]